MFNIFFFVIFIEYRATNEIMWKKYGGARQATDDNMEHGHCMLGT